MVTRREKTRQQILKKVDEGKRWGRPVLIGEPRLRQIVAVFKIRPGQFVCEVYTSFLVCEVYTSFLVCLSSEMPVGANPIMIQYPDISITNLSLP